VRLRVDGANACATCVCGGEGLCTRGLVGREGAVPDAAAALVVLRLVPALPPAAQRDALQALAGCAALGPAAVAQLAPGPRRTPPPL